MEFKFDVGETYRHTVRFHYSRLTNTVRIDVDGDVVERDRFWVWIPAFRRYEFIVGDTEQHNVTIETTIPRVGAKFVSPTCKVMIDNNLIGEY